MNQGGDSQNPNGPNSGRSWPGPPGRSGQQVSEMYREASLKYARKFWQADQNLSVEQRRSLSSAFWMQTTLIPAMGLPVIYAGIMLPNWLKKAGRLNPAKGYRGMQVFLGFVGAFVGQGIARGLGYGFYSLKFSSDQDSATIWKILGRIGPQIGSRYYTVTARDPKQAMHNPDMIDWSRELAFPFNLIQVGAPRRGQMGAQPWPLPQQPQQSQRQGYDSNNNNPQQPNHSSTSEYRWPSEDNQQNSEPAINPGPAWGVPRRETAGATSSEAVHSDEMANRQSDFDRSIESARNASDNIDAEERQRMFDELISRERQGEGVSDDFTQSERKWS